MEKIHEKKLLQLLGALLLVLCFGYLFILSRYDKVVEYEIVDSEGEKTFETWKSRERDVFFFNEKGVKYASLTYLVLKDLYTEKFKMDEAVTVNQYKVSPEEAGFNNFVVGSSVYIDSSGVTSETSPLSSVKLKREVDGRIIHITKSGKDDDVHIVRKLYDEKESTYFLPDEMTEEYISYGVVVRTVRYVAKGRKVIPIRYKSGVSL